MELPKRLPVLEDYLSETNLSNLNYKNISFSEYPTSDFIEYTPDLPGATQEQLDGTTIFIHPKRRQLHISIHPDLQKQGLAEVLIKAFVYRHGFVEIPKARITNPNMFKVIEKIKKDKNFVVSEDEHGFEIDEN